MEDEMFDSSGPWTAMQWEGEEYEIPNPPSILISLLVARLDHIN